jgi:hypothetical protein
MNAAQACPFSFPPKPIQKRYNVVTHVPDYLYIGERMGAFCTVGLICCLGVRKPSCQRNYKVISILSNKCMYREFSIIDLEVYK